MCKAFIWSLVSYEVDMNFGWLAVLFALTNRLQTYSKPGIAQKLNSRECKIRQNSGPLRPD